MNDDDYGYRKYNPYSYDPYKDKVERIPRSKNEDYYADQTQMLIDFINSINKANNKNNPAGQANDKKNTLEIIKNLRINLLEGDMSKVLDALDRIEEFVQKT